MIKTVVPGFAEKLKTHQDAVAFHSGEIEKMLAIAIEFNIETEIKGGGEKIPAETPPPARINSSWNSKVVPFEIPPSYAESPGWREKTIFGLAQNEGQEGFVKDIVQKLKEFDPSISDDKEGEAFKNVTRWASKLNKAGQIGHKKFGLKYKYFIKKEA